MTSESLRQLIKEEIQSILIKESLDHLHDNISNQTPVGRPWLNMILGLESVIEEVEAFNSLYSRSIHGPLPNVSIIKPKLQEIIKILTEIKPTVWSMDSIQREKL